jgi:hypothetical protein
MSPKILAGVGCAFFALSFGVLLVSVALPVLTDGRTSWSEAMVGIVPGALCSTISFVILVGGLVWMFAARRRARP